MASEVSICNQALSWLGGNLIISLEDGSTEAIICKANYALLRDTVLEEGKWAFATRRYVLSTPDPEPPPWGYRTKFALDTSVLTVIEATDIDSAQAGFFGSNDQGANNSGDLDWRKEEQFIVCSVDRVYVKTIVRITDVNRFTPTFNQALSTRIAADIAVPLTESQIKSDKMWVKYDRAIKVAKAANGLQGKSDRTSSASAIVRRR